MTASRITAVLGPTNTGKTHYAIERMLSYRTGVIGLPLRLLAREVYDRIVAVRGPGVVALVTGEERIVPPRAAYWVCTVEAMPEGMGCDFLAVDEIQLCADPERGHVFTDRLLNARGLHETLFLGAETMRDAISAIPDGKYNARTHIDGYLDSDDPALKELPIEVTLTVTGSDIHVDLTGTAPQTPNKPINMPLVGTVDCAVWLTLRSILLDSDKYGTIPQNSGLTRPITIFAPKGCLANPIFPAPVIARFCPGNAVADTVMKAIAPAVPQQVSAGIGNLRVMAFSGATAAGPWVHMEIMEGAYGGRYGKDGMDAVDTLYANTRNNPVEDIESHLPLRVLNYELRENVAGPGQWRGGIGSIRSFELLEDGAVSVEGDGQRFNPWGFAGGSDGSPANVDLIRANGQVEALPSKIPYRPLGKGDRITAYGPCGGGYGNPMLRSPEAVLEDVLDGLIDAEVARREYGVAIREGRHLDSDETKKLRAAD
jgi:N-methylhydantoinase B